MRKRDKDKLDHYLEYLVTNLTEQARANVRLEETTLNVAASRFTLEHWITERIANGKVKGKKP